MTGEATWEFIMNHLLMRFAVTIGALRNIAVAILMASDASDGFMLTLTFLPSIEYLGMTGATCCGRYILAIGDLERTMHRMAFFTG